MVVITNGPAEVQSEARLSDCVMNSSVHTSKWELRSWSVAKVAAIDRTRSGKGQQTETTKNAPYDGIAGD
jgi:hypothetical protein